MKQQPGRADLIIGSVLLTTALTFSHVTHLPLYLFAPLVIVGIILLAEGAATMHNDQTSIRFERWAQAQKMAPRPVTPPMERDAVRLLRDWSVGRPTTRRYAQEMGIPQERWQQIVSWAVAHGLGKLEPAQGGNQTLRWTATLDQALTLLDGLA